MSKRHRLGLGLLASLIIVVLVGIFYVSFDNRSVVLHPRGEVAQQQFNLIMFTTLLSSLVVVPVFALTFYIVWKYREGTPKAKANYRPDWDGHRGLEAAWWLIPFALITILAVITWRTSHTLDPYKPLAGSAKPITIQVVALQWKWLFLYPEQNIASVNHVQFPVGRPVNFEITADAPMNSFWIPQLAGQVYAMSGMETKLHVRADKIGTYRGSSANISGEGFADMTFIARASSQADFDTWMATAKRSHNKLSIDAYNALAEPSKKTPVITYASTDKHLYDTVMMKYMGPDHQGGHDHGTSMQKMEGSEHDSH